MCEQTEVEYLDGDVVWVKLGPCWWPGEVKDLSKLPPEIVKDFKKQPIAVVKFFQEDQYEYVKNINHIYKYSCRKKNEFIKKGLDMHRAKIAFMDKFPADVCHAETLTGGDPDIITNDEFAPEQKPSYAAIFGTPTSTKKTKTLAGRGRASTGSISKSASRSSLGTPARRIITHPRFVGQSDHEVRILEQSTPVAAPSHYTCHICGFESSRLNVIVLHNRSHSNGTYVTPSKSKGKSKKSKRKSFATTNSIDEDLELIRQGVTISTEETSDSDEEAEKEKRKNGGNKRKNNKAANSASKKAKVSSICNNLLADWGDTDEEADNEKEEETTEKEGETNEDKKDTETSEVNKSVKNELLADWDDKNTDDEDSPKNATAADDKNKEKTKASEKSCFDFQDEEDSENTVLEKSPGRKIPRVIPSKRPSKDTDDTKVANKEPEKMETDSAEKEESDTEKKEVPEPDIAAFKNLLDETAVPDFASLPDVSPNAYKKDKISDDSSSVDKTNGVMKTKQADSETVKETTDNEIKMKESEPIIATIPKKRIVRNFEEFESLLNEQKSPEEEPAKSKSTLEVSKLKSQLMSKLNESPSHVKKSPLHKVDTPEPDSEVDSKTEEDESQSSESFQKKISQSESEDTDVEKKDNTSIETIETISKDFSETPEEDEIKSVESIETIDDKPEEHEIKNEITEIIQPEPEPEIEKEKEIIQEETTEKITENYEEIPMEVETIAEPIVEEKKIQENEHVAEEVISEEKLLEEPITEQPIEEEKEEFEAKQPVVEDVIPEEIPEVKSELVDEEDEEPSPIIEEPSPIIEESPPIIEESAQIVEESKIEQTSEPQETEIIFSHTEEPQEIFSKTEENQENFPKTEETRSQKMLVDISDICIDNADNLSGLSTLAAVSELTGNLYDKQETIAQESPLTEPEVREETSTNDEVTNPPSSVTDDTESRDIMTPVQDEHPDTPTPQPKPVQTLANFSMDFSDSNSESTIIKTETQEEIITEKITDNIETSVSTTDSEENKIEICESEKPPSVMRDVPTDFESIESEIEKITSMETTSDKLNSFPENISQVPQDCISVESSSISYQDFQLADTGTSIPGSGATEFKIEPDIPTETSLESEIAKLTDHQPDTETIVQEQQTNTSSSKLLEILTDSKRTEQVPVGLTSPKSRTIVSGGGTQKVQMVFSGDKTIHKKFDPKTSKFVIKSATPKSAKSNKPIILSEKIIKPVSDIDNVSVKKVTSKRTYQDVEDIDTFIIQKPTKKANSDLDQQDIILTPKSETVKYKPGGHRGGRGKPKIIEQTIIKAADVVQQPAAATSDTQTLLDDSMFDINSMPIVLSDQILTPESIENIPMVMTDLIPSSSVSTAGQTTVQTVIAEKPQQQTIAVKRGGAIQQVKLLNKGKVTSQPEPSPKLGQNVVVKNITSRALGKNPKVYQTGSKTLKNNPAIITQPGKPGKFIILPTTTSSTTGVSKYTVGKRLTTIKSSTAVTSPTTSKQLKSVQSMGSEPTGNKIMIVTNQQGVQSRVLITPAQQKLLGCKVPGTKVSKASQLKSGMMQKSILTSKGTIVGAVNSSGMKSSPLGSQTIMTSKGQMISTQPGQMLVTSEGQVLTPISQQQLKSNMHKPGQKIKIQSSRVILPDKSGDSAKARMNVMGAKTKTVLIKGAQGQTLKKIQATSNEAKNLLLTQAGQKQLVSLASQQMGITGKQVVVTSKGQIIKPETKVTTKQAAEKLQRLQTHKTSSGTPPRIMTKSNRTQVLLSPVSGAKQQIAGSVPPLAPITGQKKEAQTPSRLEQKLLSTVVKEEKIEVPTTPVDKTAGGDKQPNQLIIQDALGNQTTVTEGQILALPSGETVDGQPQSYVLVTVDESGNLVPISNDTLMSLDPSFAAGGDMNNIVLQIDPGAQENQAQEAKSAEIPATELPVEEQLVTNQQIVETAEQQLLVDNQQLMLQEQNVLPAVTTAEELVAPEQQQVLPEETFVPNPEETQVITSDAANILQDTQQTAVACSINNGDSSQQLIITGDPESTQKFLASLSEGNTDLSSLLSGADGNIIINTDGQQILLNTDSENQILLSVNSDNLGLMQTSTESDPTQNSMYVTQQAIKNQDILAAALADTDVFQQESADKTTTQVLSKASTSAQSQLSPNSALYPMNVGSVLETSLTLGSPIMTPLEVPSVSTKKINSDVEQSLITQVPSSLELPITITDPSISQTVSQQVMLSNDLQTNLELPISISDTAITSIRSSEMNSPNFVYSLPTLDDNSDLEQKRSFAETSTVMTSDNMYSTSLTGSMSMPLLTEEPEIQPVEQEQIPEIPTSHEETSIVATTSAPETSTTETAISESDQSASFPSLSTELNPELNTELNTELNNELNTELSSELNTELNNELNSELNSELNTELNTELNSETLQTTVPEKIPEELHMPIEEELDLNPTDICSSLSEPPPGMFDKSSFSNFLNKTDEETAEALSQETESPAEIPTSESSVMNNLPILTEGADPENEAGSSDMLTTSSAVTEKSPEDMDFGVSESSAQDSISETVMTHEVQRSELSETPNSDLNSPRLDIDENSGEIPIQSPIITNLNESFSENAPEDFNSHEENKKRVNEDSDDENDAKRTKLSCD